MSIREHLVIMIDRLEYYLTKEIERNIYGTGDKCYIVLFDRMEECITARKEIDYQPYQSVEMLLEHHGYDEVFINKFVAKASYCKGGKFEDDETVSIREHLIIIIDILENHLTQAIEKSIYGSGDKYFESFYNRLVECIDARKEIDYQPYQSVEMLLEDHGYDEEFISKFIARAHCNEKGT